MCNCLSDSRLTISCSCTVFSLVTADMFLLLLTICSLAPGDPFLVVFILYCDGLLSRRSLFAIVLPSQDSLLLFAFSDDFQYSIEEFFFFFYDFTTYCVRLFDKVSDTL